MKPTAYELATYKGRQIDESKSPDYCGSWSIEIHCSQVRDPESWVHSSIKRWEKLGGWGAPETTVSNKAMGNSVKRWNAPRGTTISEAANGELVLATDYERLEQECARLRAELSACKERPGGCGYWREAARARETDRDVALKQVEALRKHIDEAQKSQTANVFLALAGEIAGLRSLLARCQEHLDPHRDAVLWGAVWEVLKVKP